MLLVGAAPSLNQVDLRQYGDVASIASNRILLHPTFKPTYLVLCDRTPYVEEMKSDRIRRYAEYGNVLASETIWDERIKSRGVPVQPRPDFRHWTWRVGVMGTPMNWDTMTEPLCSFGTIIGPMIQMAVIMGAEEIGIVGVDLQAPKTGSYHFYEQEAANEGARGRDVTRNGTDIAPRGSLERFRQAKKALDGMHVRVTNLSPLRDTPFAEVFG